MAEHIPSIFISYRGSDEVWAPDVVYTALKGEIDPKEIFKAGYNLRPGDEYPPVLEQMAKACHIMLVCIGPRWLSAANEDGTRRLDQEDDWVRREIRLSLASDNQVIPLLLGNRDEVVLPAFRDLPADIASLVLRQAYRLEPGGRLEGTLPLLIKRLREVSPLPPPSRPAPVSLSIRQRVEGPVSGKATLVRAPDGFDSTGVFVQDVASVTETGEIVALDLAWPRGTPECPPGGDPAAR
jgi:hypothetical protein